MEAFGLFSIVKKKSCEPQDERREPVLTLQNVWTLPTRISMCSNITPPCRRNLQVKKKKKFWTLQSASMSWCWVGQILPGLKTSSEVWFHIC